MASMTSGKPASRKDSHPESKKYDMPARTLENCQVWKHARIVSNGGVTLNA